MLRVSPSYLSDDEQRNVATDWIVSLIEGAMENGEVPRPSTFGLEDPPNNEDDPVYDWAMAIVEEWDAAISVEPKPDALQRMIEDMTRDEEKRDNE